MEIRNAIGKGDRSEIHCGICGEHGGDPVSVELATIELNPKQCLKT